MILLKNLRENILQLLYKPKKRTMYVVTSGDKSGGFMVYIKEKDIGNSYAFLFMPDLEVLYLTREDFISNFRYKNIEEIKQIPKDVYEHCKANFDYHAQKAGMTCITKI